MRKAASAVQSSEARLFQCPILVALGMGIFWLLHERRITKRQFSPEPAPFFCKAPILLVVAPDPVSRIRDDSRYLGTNTGRGWSETPAITVAFPPNLLHNNSLSRSEEHT